MEVTFGEYVRWARISNHKRQDEVAEAVGMSASALSKIENDKTELPRKHTVVALADALGVNRDELMVRAGYHVDEPQGDNAEVTAAHTLASLDRVLVTSGFSKRDADVVMTLVRQLAPDNHPLGTAMIVG